MLENSQSLAKSIFQQNGKLSLNEQSFLEKIERLKKCRRDNLAEGSKRVSVLISGGGPAGLIRALQSIIEGNPTKILEKRKQNNNGRENTVALEPETVELLKKYGVYDLLISQRLIYPKNSFGGISVRIIDLEKTLKEVLSHLVSLEELISYDAQIEKIEQSSDQMGSLQLSIKEGDKISLYSRPVDVLVVAEGANSKTADLLGIKRIEHLAKVPAVAVVMKDDRPTVDSMQSFFEYTTKTLTKSAKKTYYFVIFIFRIMFFSESLFNQDRPIGGSLTLTTPGQTYLGYGLNKEKSNELISLRASTQEAKKALEEAHANGDKEKVQSCFENLQIKQKEYEAFLEYWAYMSFFFANLLECIHVVISFFACRSFPESSLGTWYPIDKVSAIDIGADRAEMLSGRFSNHSVYLFCGDSAATVDPTTGKGCNTALKTSEYFQEFLMKMNHIEFSKRNQEFICNALDGYDQSMNSVIRQNHQFSIEKRRLYRPDAIGYPQVLTL